MRIKKKRKKINGESIGFGFEALGCLLEILIGFLGVIGLFIYLLI